MNWRGKLDNLFKALDLKIWQKRWAWESKCRRQKAALRSVIREWQRNRRES